MKHMLLILTVCCLVACGPQKGASPEMTKDSTNVTDDGYTRSNTPTKNIVLNNPQKDTITESEQKPNKNTEAQVSKGSTAIGLPECVRKLITGFEAEEVQNPPRKIYSYLYKGQTVYYVTPPCCDFFSDLYDSNCKLIAHPDGGITGKGDRRMPDFIEARTNEKLIWQDKRLPR